MEFTNIRLTLVPVLMILVIPFYIFTPLLQQHQLLKLINDTVAAVRASTLNASHGF